MTHSNLGPKSTTELHTATCSEQPIAWLNEHCPVITGNMSPALCFTDKLTVSLHSSPKLLTRWLLCNDHWNRSFCLIDTAWTLKHVSTGDHSFNSNDCCHGSLSQLMTYATGWGKCLSCCRCPSVLLSVSKTAEVTAFSGRPTDNNSACSYECFYLFIHPYKKKIRHTPPQAWAPCPSEWHECWPSPPHSLQQSHISWGGGAG